MREHIDLANIILPPSRVSDKEKDELVEISSINKPSIHDDAVDSFSHQDTKDTYTSPNSHHSLGFKELKIAGFILLIALILCVPKIYLSSHIYYLSKDIASLQTQRDILLDENDSLKHEVENLRYTYMILNER